MTRIINEPTAAALAYGLQRSGVTEDVLIYDLGGGTFDVTVARITPEEIAVLATAGDHDLGGKNWDDRIATMLSEKFAADTGLDPLDDPMALNEVLVRSEQAKWALSDRSATRVTLQIGAERRTYELTRDEFEAQTASLMDRTRRLTEEALGESGSTWETISGVLLVGGSTRMPMVRQYVARMAGQPPRAGVNVDEVVALGAAIRAAMDAGETSESAAPKFTLGGRRRVKDVMSHGLGAVAVSPDGSAYVNDVILRRNVPIPAEATTTYLHETHGGANGTLEVYLTQGESARPLDCSILGKYVFSGIRPTDREVSVDVALAYNANGVVQVRATQRDTKHLLDMAVEPVPDDLSWLGLPPASATAEASPDPTRTYLLIDCSASMAGEPLFEAQRAARAFPGAMRLHGGGGRFDLVLRPSRLAMRGDLERAEAARGTGAAGSGGDHEPLGRPRPGARAAWERRSPPVRGDPDRRLPRLDRGGRRAGREGAGGGDRDRGHRHRRCRPRLSPPTRQHRRGLDLRHPRRAGRGVRAHRPDDRRARPIAEDVVMNQAGPGETLASRLARAIRRGADLACAGAIGAVFGLYFYVELVATGNIWLRDALAGALIGGSIGFALNALEAFHEGAWRKLARAATWGALAGAGGGAVGLVVGEYVLGSLQGGLLGRAASWSILGLGIGVSQGLAYRSREKLRFGLIGGGLGGFVGGLLFEALRERLGNRYDLSQGLGMVVLGAGLGVCLALVEGVLARVWVQVLNGRQEGRAYLIGAGTSTLGLDERATVGLFGDSSVARLHAEIVGGPDGFSLVPRDDGQGRTRLNGSSAAGRSALADGDRIELGGTILVFRKR